MTVTIDGTSGITYPAGTIQGTGYGPAFNVYLSSAQSTSNGVLTKVAFNAKLFDTANCFDITTNYRFTPNVAGYYMVQAILTLSGGSWISGYANCYIYKNGSALFNSASNQPTNGNYVGMSSGGTVYMNGTTDYLEVYHVHDSSGTNPQNLLSGSIWNFFSGAMVRGA